VEGTRIRLNREEGRARWKGTRVRGIRGEGRVRWKGARVRGIEGRARWRGLEYDRIEKKGGLDGRG
jgi:hypothetical protein